MKQKLINLHDEVIEFIKTEGGGGNSGVVTPPKPEFPPMEDGYVPTGKKYGVKIAKAEANPATRVEYILDAVGMAPAKVNGTTGTFDYGSWKDIWFVKNNYPCMVKNDGTEDYKLNPNDYSKKEDGSNSDVANITYNGNAMSRIPLVYIKQYTDETHEYIIVSDVKHDDTYNAFAHTDDSGVIKDKMYISIYKGTLSSGKLRSIAGQVLSVSTTADQEVTYAKANGPRYNIRSWSQRNLINALLTIIGKNDNGQETFGNGNVGSSAKLNTGTLNTIGQFYGVTNNQTAQVKVFHIEGWWGDIYDRLNGLLLVNGSYKVAMTGPYDFIGNGANYKNLGVPAIASSDYIKTSTSDDNGRLPAIGGATDQTHQCDRFYKTTTGTMVALVGGDWGHTLNAGPFCLHLDAAASSAHTNVGAGLSLI